MMRSARSLRVRLCPSWPGLAPPGFDFSRCSLRSVEGGFEDVREVFSGRCRRSTKSISSSLLRRSSSLRPIPPFNQSKQRDARAWVIAGLGLRALYQDLTEEPAPDFLALFIRELEDREQSAN